nr:Kinectin (Kinesin receptor) (CG 1 antigen) [Hymenolepis microstoma]
MSGNEVLKQLADLQCKNVILEEKYSDAQYEVQCLQSDLQQSQSVIENLQKALEASRKENSDLTQNSRGNDIGSAATIEALREENRLARRKVTELEAEFRTLKTTRNSLNHGRIPEDIEDQLQEWKRRLALMPSADIKDLFSAINDRLDRALMNDARANESEFAQQELKNQLRDAHNSANELADRVEVLLAEKEALKREANIWNGEKSDLLASRGLLEQRIASLERQLEELRGKLHFESEEARAVKMESQQLLLERNSQTVQFNALVESLAATLSTIDSPCEASEAAVKETVGKMMAELLRLRKAGIDLEKKTEQLLEQFEYQFANGQSLCEELDALRRELDDEKRVKERIQCELEGFRLISSQRQLTPQKMGKIVSICEKLSIPVEKHPHSDLFELVAVKISDLIDQGCISPECIQGSDPIKERKLGKKAEHNHKQVDSGLRNGTDNCSSCSHLLTTPLDLASRAPDWTDLEEKRVQLLCANCLACLAMALKQRLRTMLNSDVLNEKREKNLLEELEKSKREVEELHEKILTIENEKSDEYEKLEQMVSKLEALRQHQAKRIAGLQSKSQRQSTLEVQKAQELSAAKSFLVENRQKHLRLLNFRNALGRLLGIDAWLYPNPEGLIIQRIQQILMSFSTQGISLYSHPITVPCPTIQSSSSALQLPALTYSKDRAVDSNAPLSNTPTVNFVKGNPAGSSHFTPKAASRRSQSVSGKNVRRY